MKVSVTIQTKYEDLIAFLEIFFRCYTLSLYLDLNDRDQPTSYVRS